MFTRLALVVAALTSSIAVAGTQVTEQDYSYLPHCQAPVASVVVSNLTCKAAACQPSPAMSGQMAALLAMAGQSVPDYSRMGAGMGNALTTALKATNCFDVQEREALEELRKEMELAGVKVEAKPADFMIMGAITSLESSQSKGSFGAGMLPVVGGLSRNKAALSLTLDLRVVEVRKANVLSAKAFTATSENVSWGIQGAGLLGAAGLMGSYSEGKGSPVLDRVAGDTVVQSVNYLVDLLAKSAVTYRPPVVVEKQVKAPEPTTEESILGF